MKKMLAAITCFIGLISANSISANAQTFKPGDNVFNLGIGVGSVYYETPTSVTPPVSLSFEHGLDHQKFGIGGIFATVGYKQVIIDDDYEYHYYVLGVRGDYHFFMNDKFDTYGGVMIGYRMENDKFISANGDGGYNLFIGGLGLDIFVGGRYYFDPNWAVMAELGYGYAFFNIGVSYKLGK
jgi:hypothetical protein